MGCGPSRQVKVNQTGRKLPWNTVQFELRPTVCAQPTFVLPAVNELNVSMHCEPADNCRQGKPRLSAVLFTRDLTGTHTEIVNLGSSSRFSSCVCKAPDTPAGAPDPEMKVKLHSIPAHIFHVMFVATHLHHVHKCSVNVNGKNKITAQTLSVPLVQMKDQCHPRDHADIATTAFLFILSRGAGEQNSNEWRCTPAGCAGGKQPRHYVHRNLLRRNESIIGTLSKLSARVPLRMSPSFVLSQQRDKKSSGPKPLRVGNSAARRAAREKALLAGGQSTTSCKSTNSSSTTSDTSSGGSSSSQTSPREKTAKKASASAWRRVKSSVTQRMKAGPPKPKLNKSQHAWENAATGAFQFKPRDRNYPALSA